MTTRLRIIIPGGNGQVGSILSRHFHAQGHEVIVLARRPAPAPWRVVRWDGEQPGDWTAELENSDVVINLSGRSVNCRYTATNRKAIMDSRTGTTRLLGRAIGQLSHPPRLWMNASTATIYRHIYDRPMDERTAKSVATNGMHRRNGGSALRWRLAGRPSSRLIPPMFRKLRYAAPWL